MPRPKITAAAARRESFDIGAAAFAVWEVVGEHVFAFDISQDSCEG